MSDHSDTPRTDAVAKSGDRMQYCEVVHVDFARQLERELAALERLVARKDAALEHYEHISIMIGHGFHQNYAKEALALTLADVADDAKGTKP